MTTLAAMGCCSDPVGPETILQPFRSTGVLPALKTSNHSPAASATLVGSGISSVIKTSGGPLDRASREALATPVRDGGGPSGRSVVQETARTARTASGRRRGIDAPTRENAIQGAEKVRSPLPKLNAASAADAPSA